MLISAQNHETLVQMEDELKKALPVQKSIVIRVERSGVDENDSALRQATDVLLRSASRLNAESAAIMSNQLRRIGQALNPVDEAEQTIGDQSFETRMVYCCGHLTSFLPRRLRTSSRK